MPRAQPVDAPIMLNVEPLLYGLTNDELKWYASALPGKTPARKADMVNHILATLRDPAALRGMWEQLAPDQRDAISEVVHRFDGRYDGEVIRAKYPLVSAPKNPRSFSYGFVFGHKQEDREPNVFDLFFLHTVELGTRIPADVLALLRGFVPPPPAAKVRSSDALPSLDGKHGEPASEVFASDAEAAIFHDLAATLHLVAQGKVSVGAATRLPSLGTLKTLRQRLLISDYFADDYERAEESIRPFALILLVQAAKWAAPDAKGTKLELTKAGQALLTTPITAEHVRDVWNSWLKSDLLDEFSRIRNIRGQQAKGTRLTKPADRRPLLAEALRRSPPQRWINLDEFFRFVRAERQSPVLERNENTALYLGAYQEYGWLGYAGTNYWDIVTGSYLRVLLFEYAATLGLVDIAYTRPEETPHSFGDAYGLDEFEYLSRYDGLLAIRITKLGAYVLGLTDEYTPPAPVFDTSAPLLKVLPNLDIVITDAQRLAPNERAFIERIAAPQSEGVYRLDRDLLIEAFQNGLPLDQVKAFLSARSGTSADELPQLVRVFFDDIERRLSAVRERGTMVVLEGDPYLLTELAHAAGLRSLIQLGKIGNDTVLLVPQEHETAVRRQLKKLGYVPKKR